MSDLGDNGDPIRARRARIAHWVSLGKRVGYTALLVSIVAFVVAIVTGFNAAVVWVSVVGLIVACVVLPLPIVFGYGIRSAEREDRAQGLG